jgi:hypothetical protein
MIRRPIIPATLALTLWVASAAAAQVSVEGRVGGAVGNHAPAAAGLETHPGLSLAGSIEYTPVPYGSLYASFSRASFGCEEGFCDGAGATITAQGFGAGVRAHPWAAPLPWFRAGALLYGSTVSTSSGDESTGMSPGLELGVGTVIPFAGRFGVLPGIYLRSQAGAERTTLLGAEIGFRMSF